MSVKITPVTTAQPFRIGLVVTTYNRPYYVWRTLRRLRDTLAGSEVVIAVVDDASASGFTQKAIRDFAGTGLPVATLLKQERNGFDVHASLRMGWDYLREQHDCLYLANVDSDVLSKPGWLNRMEILFKRERQARGPLILTGFNTHNHPVLEQFEDYCVKKSFGGVNTFFDSELYDELVRPNLLWNEEKGWGWDWYVVKALREAGYPMLCTTPSEVEHIGRLGQWSRWRHHDKAIDY